MKIFTELEGPSFTFKFSNFLIYFSETWYFDILLAEIANHCITNLYTNLVSPGLAKIMIAEDGTR